MKEKSVIMGYSRGSYAPPKAKTKWKEGVPCCLCGQPLLQKHLSQNPIEREREMKWGYHFPCFSKTIGVMDRNAE